MGLIVVKVEMRKFLEQASSGEMRKCSLPHELIINNFWQEALMAVNPAVPLIIQKFNTRYGLNSRVTQKVCHFLTNQEISHL